MLFGALCIEIFFVVAALSTVIVADDVKEFCLYSDWELVVISSIQSMK